MESLISFSKIWFISSVFGLSLLIIVISITSGVNCVCHNAFMQFNLWQLLFISFVAYAAKVAAMFLSQGLSTYVLKIKYDAIDMHERNKRAVAILIFFIACAKFCMLSVVF